MVNSQDTDRDAGEAFRIASEPFTIHLNDVPYVLTEDVLKSQVDLRIQRKKKWHSPRLTFLSFKDGQLKLQNSGDRRSYVTTIGVEPDKLHVSCNCGEPVETLCLHTYRALQYLIFYWKTKYFERYRPDGLFEISEAHKRHFETTVSGFDQYILPKKNLGTVYHLSDEPTAVRFKNIMDLPEIPVVEDTMRENTALVYILIEPIEDDKFAFLMPCLGVLNYDGNEMKSFTHFIRGNEEKYDAFITQNQRILNRLCYAMRLQADNLRGVLCDGIEPSGQESLLTLFNLWARAVPLLQQGERVYSYTLYDKSDLRTRPKKMGITKINMHSEIPRLHFRLAETEAYYQLEVKAVVKKKAVTRPNWDTPFFLRQDQDFYVLSSLRDAGLAQWMHKSKERITIFKEHFDEFEHDFLRQIERNWPVRLVNASSWHSRSPL
jgi:hypothetical protein